ncbi:MAG: ATP-binding protein [Xenococcaceae cyanobacterium]
MTLDVRKFFKAANPSRTPGFENEEDRKYYINFSSVRSRITEELELTITQLSPDEPTCQLFTGHIGCGKTTELLHLTHKLEVQSFHVVYFNTIEDLDLSDVEISDILLMIARQVSKSLEEIGIYFRPNYFQRLFREIREILQTPVDIENFEFSAGIAFITAKTKGSRRQHDKLRSYLESQTPSIIDSINRELLRPAIERLQSRDKKGLVVIIDGLDRVQNTLKPNGHTQPEYLFLDRGEQLKKLQCHVVYTIPLI